MGSSHNFVSYLTLYNHRILLFTAIYTPYRIAFYDKDDIIWFVIDSFVDSVFGIDMVLNFFMAYYNEHDEIVDNRKKVACHYFKGWFIIDITSIFPVSQIMDS
jgi:hypothetical protein